MALCGFDQTQSLAGDNLFIEMLSCLALIGVRALVWIRSGLPGPFNGV